MRKLFLVCLSVAALVGLSQNPLFAQGNGQGTSRSLKALSHAGSQGSSQAAKKLTRTTNGVGKAKGGWEQAGAAATDVPELPAPTSEEGTDSSNPQKILDHRLAQAEHLRSISARNGNEHLLNTADRMEANAQRNYDRQTGLSAPTDSNSLPAPTVTDPLSTESVGQARRGFWFRSR